MSQGVAKNCRTFATLLLLLGPFCLADAFSSARSPGQGELIEFDIPALALPQALDVYSEVTGVAVLVDQELIVGRRSAAVSGRFSARTGLSLLLSGTGLMAVFTREDAFTLRRAEVSRPVEGSPQPLEDTRRVGGSYAGEVQAALEEALCRSRTTRPGNYRIAFQLWIGPQGRVEHSHLLGSSGDARRDAALIELLRELRVPQAPPSSLPQPITILVLPEREGSGVHCQRFEGVR
ncbi:TonB-dependent outer membrane receptor [Stutzerimonas stutzeri]|uniref:secretin and TonB N-terminal domain-containing protein n=1 Tax=Stutzerimonas stutzeri TaxID=316 RepID=UPI0024A0E96C|nr:secretin and TonB N-terminal domain-containing protein [Stutzerimonas stutzeri]GLZ24004.1 TonB-dependent outer membrane receptor [Stutzerimonas stutzeri]